MIKVLICKCTKSFESRYGTGNFTKGEYYYVRPSKNGELMARSDEGYMEHVDRKMMTVRPNYLKDNFFVVKEVYFRNRQECDKQMDLLFKLKDAYRELDEILESKAV